MRTMFESIVAKLNQGWRLKSLNGAGSPVGAYFVYQKMYGPPIDGGTQPIWSYDLTKMEALWKQEGGYIFNENGEILRR